VSYPDGTRDLWRSDGHAEGTFAVAALEPDTDLAQQDLRTTRALGVVGDALLLADCGNGLAFLWRSDGTEEGTVRLADDAPCDTQDDVAVSAEVAYFGVRRGGQTGTIWRTDGTLGGTRAVHTFTSWYDGEPPYLAFAAGVPYVAIAAEGSSTAGLYRLDRAEPVVVHDRPTHELFACGDALYGRRLAGSHTELWGGRPDAPAHLADGGGLLSVSHACISGTYVTAEAGRRVLASDGTSAGTSRVFPESDRVEGFQPATNGIVFTGAEPGGTITVFGTDGTADGTEPLRQVGPGPDHPQALGVAAGRAFYARWSVPGLVASDGTPRGTYEYASEVVYELGATASVGERLFFRGNDADRAEGYADLWATDGTPDGTVVVAATEGLVSVLGASDRVYFTARGPAGGTQLWVVGADFAR
jgi:hypothetical protein